MSTTYRNRGMRLLASAFVMAAFVAGCEGRDRTDYDTNPPSTTGTPSTDMRSDTSLNTRDTMMRDTSSAMPGARDTGRTGTTSRDTSR